MSHEQTWKQLVIYCSKGSFFTSRLLPIFMGIDLFRYRLNLFTMDTYPTWPIRKGGSYWWWSHDIQRYQYPIIFRSYNNSSHPTISIRQCHDILIVTWMVGEILVLREKHPWYGDTKTKTALKIRPFRYTQQNPFRTHESQRTYHISYVYIYICIYIYIYVYRYHEILPYRSAINDGIISWFNFLPPFGGKSQLRRSCCSRAAAPWFDCRCSLRGQRSWADGKGSIVKHWMG